ncbi:MAG: hypothetical protein MZW92_35495 [Comamonadaceae bacterium]|nr:hypothetical protein [Comamonadaceae bacterium]
MSRLTKPLLFASSDRVRAGVLRRAGERPTSTPIVELWLDDDDICCVHPGGPRLMGHADGAQLVARDPRQRRAEHPRHVAQDAWRRRRSPLHNVVEEIVVSAGPQRSRSCT